MNGDRRWHTVWTDKNGRKYEQEKNMEHFESSASVVELEIDEADDEVRFDLSDGTFVVVRHYQDCCEHVGIDKLDKEDLKKIVNDGAVTFDVKTRSGDEEADSLFGSTTFTFITVQSRNHNATFSFRGESNGYYSEDANMYVCIPVDEKKGVSE